MKNTLIDIIESDFKDSLPACVFFVKGEKNEPLQNTSLKLVKSKFYNTQKMSCYSIYKPSILRKNDEL